MGRLSVSLAAAAAALAAFAPFAAFAVGEAATETRSYVFGHASRVGYAVEHPLHHVHGVTHTLAGRVAIAGGHLVTPVTLAVPLLSFDSGNANRDGNAAGTLDVARFPLATLEVQRFDEARHTLSGAETRITGTAHGRLTLHGVTRPIGVPLEARFTPSGLTVDGAFQLLLSDYRIDRPSLFFRPIDDRVGITVHAVGVTVHAVATPTSGPTPDRGHGASRHSAGAHPAAAGSRNP